jgi:hypothetical protein
VGSDHATPTGNRAASGSTTLTPLGARTCSRSRLRRRCSPPAAQGRFLRACVHRMGPCKVGLLVLAGGHAPSLSHLTRCHSGPPCGHRSHVTPSVESRRASVTSTPAPDRATAGRSTLRLPNCRHSRGQRSRRLPVDAQVLRNVVPVHEQLVAAEGDEAAGVGRPPNSKPGTPRRWRTRRRTAIERSTRSQRAVPTAERRCAAKSTGRYLSGGEAATCKA